LNSLASVPRPYLFGRMRLGTKFMLVVGTVVSLIITLFLYTLYSQSKTAILEQIDRQSRTLLQQIVLTRAWIADHGGVFVHQRPGDQENPYLPKNDIQDGKGGRYLMQNPALATRQLASYAARSGLYSIHLTSLKLRNPDNAPTPLEREALLKFDAVARPDSDGISGIFTKGGHNYYCRIIPLRTEKACLVCHADQGYREGDTRGALSVTLPMDEADRAIAASRAGFFGLGGAILLVVLALLYVLLNSIVLTPLTHLQQVADRLSAGHYGIRAVVQTGDEFENLAVAFNTMTGRIIDGYYQSVKTLATAVEMRDPYTRGHIDRVSVYTVAIARRMGLSEQLQEQVEMGAILHDIGKIGIADAILNKNGPFTAAERMIMESHPLKGAEIVSPAVSLAFALPAIRNHHERFDGSGYPDRLRGEEIPMVARILAVADTYDAMTTDRPYRCGLSPQAALREICGESGSQFDPAVVAAFIIAYHEGFQTFPLCQEESMPVAEGVLAVGEGELSYA